MITYTQYFNGGPAGFEQRTMDAPEVAETVQWPATKGNAVYRLRRSEGHRVMRGSGYEYDFTGDYA